LEIDGLELDDSDDDPLLLDDIDVDTDDDNERDRLVLLLLLTEDDALLLVLMLDDALTESEYDKEVERDEDSDDETDEDADDESEAERDAHSGRVSQLGIISACCVSDDMSALLNKNGLLEKWIGIQSLLIGSDIAPVGRLRYILVPASQALITLVRVHKRRRNTAVLWTPPP
jgi:hypothetical protein